MSKTDVASIDLSPWDKLGKWPSDVWGNEDWDIADDDNDVDWPDTDDDADRPDADDDVDWDDIKDEDDGTGTTPLASNTDTSTDSWQSISIMVTSGSVATVQNGIKNIKFMISLTTEQNVFKEQGFND